MDGLLFGLFAFLRPLMFIDVGWRLGPLNAFEAGAIALTSLLLGALVLKTVRSGQFQIGLVDLLSFAFIIWCAALLAAFPEQSRVEAVAKITLPFISYTIARNVIGSQAQYRRYLLLTIIGFGSVAVVSAGMTLMGAGVDKINYWTGLVRYQGVFENTHNAGHSMLFLLMLMAIYVAVVRETGQSIRRATWVAFGVVAALALFFLYKTYVRTALLGLAIFLSIYCWFYARRLLWLGFAAGAALLAFNLEILQTLFFDVMKVASGQWEFGEIASGRPERWAQQWQVFSSQSVEHILAGAGVGNVVDVHALSANRVAVTDSHNDFFDVLVQTGVIGLLLFLAVQLALFRAVWRMPSDSRYALLALLVAVEAMNFGSNSYVARFGLAQLLYFVLALSAIPTAPKEAVAPAEGQSRRAVAAGAAEGRLSNRAS